MAPGVKTIVGPVFDPGGVTDDDANVSVPDAAAEYRPATPGTKTTTLFNLAGLSVV